MWYIIIIVAIIIAFTGVGKHALFNPQVNSALCIIYICWILFTGIKTGQLTAVMFICWALSIVDCIRDIKVAKHYYENIEVRVDPLYRLKSLTALFTWGLSRVVFLLFADVFIARSATIEAKKILEKKKIVPHGDMVINDCATSFAKRHFYHQYKIKYWQAINKMLIEGSVLSNEMIIDKEFQRYKEKLEKAYPKSIIGKMGEIISEEGQAAKKERENAENEISLQSRLYAYVDKEFYNDCQHKISESLETCGTLSPSSILWLDGLKNISELHKNDFNLPVKWAEYLIIFLMQPLVQEQTIEDCDLSDRILENHQYRHIKGLPMLTRNAEDNPLLALDDDD